jgi:hypothetical protein
VVLIGEKQISWEDVLDIDTACAMEMIKGNCTFLFNRKSRLVDEIEKARNQISRSGQIDITYFLPQISSSQSCSKPRDKVFGLLNCANTIFPPGFVDYRNPVHEVFRDATRLLIETYGSLNVIVYGEFNDWIQSQGLPSWSPYWGKSYASSISSDFDAHAANSRPHILVPVNLSHKLHVQGKLIDSVSLVLAGHPHMLSLGYLPNRLTNNDVIWRPIRDLCYQAWLYSRNELDLTSGSASSEELPLDIVREVVDTLCCHEVSSEPPFKLTDLSIEETYRVVASGQLDNMLHRQELETHCKVLDSEANGYFRFVAILKSGRLALVRDNAVQEGDHVAILHGLDVPCILRKARGENEWTFRGDAFIKGIMQGEAVTWAEDEADTFMLV